MVVGICVAGPIDGVQLVSGGSNSQDSSMAPDGTVRTMPGSKVDETAKLGKNIYIGYYARVEAEAKIGDNVIVLSDSVIPPKCQVADNQVVINGPFTNDLIFLLQDLESINVDYRKTHQSTVDAILSDEKK